MIAYPIFGQLIPELESPIQVRGDVEVYGLNVVNFMETDISANEFIIFDNKFNISIPCVTNQIDSLFVVGTNETCTSYFDQVLFTASGELNIEINNLNYLHFEKIEGNYTPVMHVHNRGNFSIPYNLWWPKATYIEDITLNMNNITTPQFASISILGDKAKIFFSFFGNGGNLTISGNQNFSMLLTDEFVGLIINVSLSGNYKTSISGNLNVLHTNNWEEINLFVGSSNGSYFETRYPRGELSFNGKTEKPNGSQDLKFYNFVGNLHVYPSIEKHFYRVIFVGDTNSLISELTGRTLDLASKNCIDYFWSPLPLIPQLTSPILISGIALLPMNAFLILKIKKRKLIGTNVS